MRRVINRRIRSTVILTLKGGATFRGLLYDFDTQALALRAVEHIADGTLTPTPFDGELIVLLGDVLYMQLIP